MRRIKILMSAILLLALCPMSLTAQEIGLQLHSLRDQLKTDVPGTLAKLKEWKIKELEGGGTHGLLQDEFNALLKKNDLTIVSVGADFQQLADNPQSAVDAAKVYGAKYVVCFWVPHNGNEFTLEDIKKAVTVFNTAGKVLRDNGITLCYHPHGYEFRPYEKGTLFDYLMTNTNPDYLAFEMDVFWIKHPGQDPVALLKKYPTRFKLLHLKDRKPGTEGNQNGSADVESNVVLGQGDVGIEAVMKEAKKIGIKHFFIEDESSRSVEQIPLSLAFLRKIKY